MLSVSELNVAYGNIGALHEVSLHVGTGEFVAIVGPNGAGKSTLFNAISGVVPAKSGSIRFFDEDLLALAPARRAALCPLPYPPCRPFAKSKPRTPRC